MKSDRVFEINQSIAKFVKAQPDEFEAGVALLEIAIVMEAGLAEAADKMDVRTVVGRLIAWASKCRGIHNLYKEALDVQNELKAEAASRYAANYERELHATQVLFHIRAMRGLRQHENTPIKGWGYSQWEMKQAFDRVCDPTDWKAPIRRCVPGHQLDVTLAAIAFFTATEPTADKFEWENWYVVESIGYRAGPAGDH